MKSNRNDRPLRSGWKPAQVEPGNEPALSLRGPEPANEKQKSTHSTPSREDRGHLEDGTIRRRLVLMAALIFFAMLAAPTAWVYAQVGGNFDLSWSKVAGGGGTSAGGNLSLAGTIGQPDAGTQSGGAFSLQGGFWGAAISNPASTATPTQVPISTSTPVRTTVPSSTPTVVAANTSTPTPTRTSTPVSTSTVTPTGTNTPLSTSTVTPTRTNTPIATSTNSPTNTRVPSGTPTLASTNTPTNTPVSTSTSTPTRTSTPTNGPTNTPTITPTGTVPTATFTTLPTNTPTSSNTPVNTNTPTNVPTYTRTSTPTNTETSTPTSTLTQTNTPTNTPTRVATGTPTRTPVSTATATAPSCAIAFEDVHISDWFYPYVGNMYCQGVIGGYDTSPPCSGPGATCFKPYNTTTRGQFTKIVVRAFALPINTRGGPHFRDVPQGSTFYDYVETGYNRGLWGGYADGKFKPANTVNRGQVAKMVVNAAIQTDPAHWTLQNPTTNTFQDVHVGNTFFPYVETAYSHGAISGYPCGSWPAGPCVPPNNRPYFEPDLIPTRAQISKITYLVSHNGQVTP